MEKIKKIRNLIKLNNLDGYIIPKNNNFFGEYVNNNEDNLKYISSFSGSAGIAIILLKKNYIFVDGRYTIQAEIQCGKNFKVCTIPKEYPFKIFKNKNLKIGFDPKLHTEISLRRYFFNSSIKLVPLKENLIDTIWKREKYKNIKPFYSISKEYAGEDVKNKIKKLTKLIKFSKANYLFITSSENIAWLLNIRGQDTSFSPLPNSHAIISKEGNIKLFCNLKKINKSLRLKLKKYVKFFDFNLIPNIIDTISKQNVIIDISTCSIFYKTLFKKNNFIIEKQDPINYLKALKNNVEIKNSIQSHIYDGAALTKFIFWLKNNFKNKQITEIDAQNKLLNFRKKNKTFKSLSFPTISGSGPNSAIIHYKADEKSNRILKKGDVYLVDSGGQYSYGTTDVTRTLSLDVANEKIKDIYTRVLKGHIAVATYKLSNKSTGEQIDKKARNPLKQINLDYPHGTGHGVGYFLNVHEGPQAISRGNKVTFKPGMITSNEPGYYKKNHFGIRIENLTYVKKLKNKMQFEDLTLAPIEKDLIKKNLLTRFEKNWLNNYHQKVFHHLKKFMNKVELLQLKEACSNI